MLYAILLIVGLLATCLLPDGKFYKFWNALLCSLFASGVLACILVILIKI